MLIQRLFIALPMLAKKPEIELPILMRMPELELALEPIERFVLSMLLAELLLDMMVCESTVALLPEAQTSAMPNQANKMTIPSLKFLTPSIRSQIYIVV